MFITKKHISRRTVLRGSGVDAGAAASGRDDPGLPRRWRKLRPRRSPDSSAALCRTAWRPGYWVPSTEGALDAVLPFNWKPLEPFRDRTVILSGLHSRSAEPPPGATGADHWVAACVPVRGQTQEDRRRRRARRQDHRPDDRRKDRPREPDAVHAARGGGSGREFEQLRRRL